MSAVAEPKTPAEWEAHAAALSGEELHDKVRAANTIAFVLALKERGMSAAEIRGVFEIFVRRLVACRELPPAGGYYDLQKMMAELAISL